MIDIKWLLKATQLITRKHPLLTDDLNQIINDPSRPPTRRRLEKIRKEADFLIQLLQAIDERLTDAIVELEQGDTTVSGKRVLRYSDPVTGRQKMIDPEEETAE